jgi:hypothetical protein
MRAIRLRGNGGGVSDLPPNCIMLCDAGIQKKPPAKSAMLQRSIMLNDAASRTEWGNPV